MKKLCLTLFSMVVLVLAGCKSEITMPVKYSEVFGQPKIKESMLALEVPTCTERDTEMESSTLLQLKQQVGYLFPNHKYLGCKREGWDNIARFEIPIKVGGIGIKECTDNELCVTSSQDSEAMIVSLGKKIKERINQLAKSSNVYGPKDVKLTIRLENDSSSSLKIVNVSSFLSDGKKTVPAHLVDGTYPAGANWFITLSDVGAAALLYRGVINVMLFPGRRVKEVPAAKS